MKIAIVGATGVVGREVVKILLDKKLVEYTDITLFASKSSAGKNIVYKDKSLEVHELTKKSIKNFDYALFCCSTYYQCNL